LEISALETKCAKADDAAPYLALAIDLETVGQTNQAAKARAVAIKLLRKKALDRPRDTALQAQLANALWDDGQLEETERVLRSATKTTPDAWLCWSRLAAFLASKANILVFGSSNAPSIPAGASWPPTAERMTKAKAYLDEADACQKRSEQLAARESQALLESALYSTDTAFLRLLIGGNLESDQPFSTRMMGAMTTDDVCDHWADAARCCGTNFNVAGFWCFAEAYPALKAGVSSPLAALPEKRRKRVLEAIAILEKLSKSPIPGVAAGSLEKLGVVHILVARDFSQAEADFRRAVALDPTRVKAWDGLVAALVQRDHSDLASVCEQRLKYDDTATNRVLFAKALLRAGLEKRSLEEARVAIKLEPQEPVGHVCLAALLLRNPAVDLESEELAEHLRLTFTLLDKNPNGDKQNCIRIAAAFNIAILLALEGNVQNAREVLTSVKPKLKGDDQFESQCREIESALVN
jgi:tetratricopeptide (TPR) repeat protein